MRRILDAAWSLAAERGLTGWTLRDLGAVVGMRAPSLYVYIDSKHGLYDALFADGNRQLLHRIETTVLPPDPTQALRTVATEFVDFCVEDSARYQLLFLRTVPGFVPSPESYALAERVLEAAAQALARTGITGEKELDLWTALLIGLATQQLSNDPGGRRWIRLVDEAVDRFVMGGSA